MRRHSLVQAVLKVIKRDNLIENVRVTGAYVKKGLEELQVRCTTL